MAFIYTFIDRYISLNYNALMYEHDQYSSNINDDQFSNELQVRWDSVCLLMQIQYK